MFLTDPPVSIQTDRCRFAVAGSVGCEDENPLFLRCHIFEKGRGEKGRIGMTGVMIDKLEPIFLYGQDLEKIFQPAILRIQTEHPQRQRFESIEELS